MMMLLAPDCDLATILLACCTERLEHVSAYKPSLEEAVALAYEGLKSVQFNGMFDRRDIASRYVPAGPFPPLEREVC